MSNLLLLILILLIPLLLLAVGAVLIKSRRKTAGKCFLTAAALYSVLVAEFIAVIALLFSRQKNFYMCIFLVIGIFVFLFFMSLIWDKFRKKYIYCPIAAACALCFVITFGYYAYQKHIDNIPTVGENDMLYKYKPGTENTELAILDEAAEISFTSDFPKMDGATALYPIYAAFANAAGYVDYDEYVQCNKTSSAYENIVNGVKDIIFIAEPSEEQKQYAAENNVELIYTPIGREAFVFFVNSKNPLEDISLEDIRKIYSGEITNWEELNVRNLGEIKAFQRNEGSGSQSALIRLMEGREIIEAPETVINDMGGIIKKAADYKNFKNAIGYSFRFYANEMVQNDQIKLLSIDGAKPDIDNIENNTYPIASDFYAVIRSDASENTKKLLDWILSGQGQTLIRKTGYTPIKQ